VVLERAVDVELDAGRRVTCTYSMGALARCPNRMDGMTGGRGG
jgi:hypothetical protein